MTTTDALVWLALNCYFEARGESFDGKKMIAHVVLNRAQRRNMNVADVIRESRQFSWYNSSVIPHIDNPAALFECFGATFKALMERLYGLDGYGADHYHADYVDPYWNDSMQAVKTVGNHIFYDSSG